jgi:uncharacterized protein (TIGR02145 family)
MYKLILRVLALAVTVMFWGLGCNDSGADTNGNVDAFLERFRDKSTEPNDDDGNNLVLGNGQAWTYGNSGFIFTSNNRVFEIYKVGDNWWYLDTLIYQTDGDIITINSIQGIYSISGNELNIGICSSCIFTKTNGIEPKTGYRDSRDNQPYKVIKVGTQVWLGENLKYAATGSVCYDNNQSYCAIYGRLYDWNTAKNAACPAGFHLPSDSEWDILVNFAGGEITAGKKLKAKSGWSDNGNYNGNSTDDYGFAALPGGGGPWIGGFNGAGDYGNWWSATESNAESANSLGMYYGDEVVYWGSAVRTTLFSVRCVKDN